MKILLSLISSMVMFSNIMPNVIACKSKEKIVNPKIKKIRDNFSTKVRENKNFFVDKTDSKKGTQLEQQIEKILDDLDLKEDGERFNFKVLELKFEEKDKFSFDYEIFEKERKYIVEKFSEKGISYKEILKVELGSVIKFTDYQVFGKSNELTIEDIKIQVKRWNPNLNLEYVDLELIKGKVVVKAKSHSIYKGKVEITYKYISIANVKKLIRNINFDLRIKHNINYNSFLKLIRNEIKEELRKKANIDIDKHPENDHWHKLGLTIRDWSKGLERKIKGSQIGEEFSWTIIVSFNHEWKKIFESIDNIKIHIAIIN